MNADTARTADVAMTRLRAMSSSPYEPEPPRRHVFVEAIIRVAERRGLAHVTPQYSNVDDREKVEHEYAVADEFWRILAGAARVTDLTGKDVLDVGCGWGGKVLRAAERAQPRMIVGFDLPDVFRPEVPTAEAKRRGLDRCQFLVGYAERIPFGDRGFDYLIMEDVLEHVDNPSAVHPGVPPGAPAWRTAISQVSVSPHAQGASLGPSDRRSRAAIPGVLPHVGRRLELPPSRER